MSRSAIMVVNTTAGTELAAGSTYPINQIVRRYGSDIESNGVGIVLKTPGYYKISGTITITAAAAGNLTIELFNNGVQMPGVISTETKAADQIDTLPIDAIVRVNCCGNPAVITVVIDGVAATTYNAVLTAIKL